MLRTGVRGLRGAGWVLDGMGGGGLKGGGGGCIDV